MIDVAKREPLGTEDAAWLHMEDETSPMVVNVMLELGAKVDPARLDALFAKLAAIPRFRARVVEPRLGVGVPHFEPDPHFDVARHVEHVEVTDDAALRAFVGDAVSALLPRDRPLWRAYVVEGRATTVIFRVHHAIADGFALLGLLLSLCDPADVSERDLQRAHPPTAAPPTTLEYARAVRRLVTLSPDPSTPLRNPLGRTKRVAWTDPIALADVKAIARALHGTVNDVLVATTAGALRRYLARAGVVFDGQELRAMVPVNLRAPDAPLALGNRFGLALIDLPVAAGDPLARVRATEERMQTFKATPEAAVSLAVLNAMGFAPQAIERAGVTFFGKKASLVLTNVPGPRQRVSIAGAPLEKVVFWAPQSGHMGLGVSIFSYAGAITIGVVADTHGIADPTALAADLHAELDAIAAASRGEVSGTLTA